MQVFNNSHLVHSVGLVWVEVLGYFQTEESFSIRVELTCLNRVFGIEGRSPVIEETGSVYYDETFYVIESILRGYQMLLVHCEGGKL